MTALALKEMPSPALAPSDEVIDLDHLSRMTLGERSLEREVLELFRRQADILLPRIAAGSQTFAAAAAHTLKGSARGIGAWQVARAADTVEAAAMSSQLNLPKAVSMLAACIAEARVAIADLLRAH
jgi:HPt (histidine-containing phosphotransfer) domain-containing protein